MKNPYRALPKGSFPIVYEGEVGDFHCFRVKMKGKKSFDQYLGRSQIERWMLTNAYGKNQISNDAVTFPNPDNEDVFVLMESMLDIVRFEEVFPVSGFSPSLVA